MIDVGWLSSPAFHDYVLECADSWQSKSLDGLNTKDRQQPKDEAENTFGLPDGEDIEELLKTFFARQAREILGTTPTIGEPLPEELPGLEHYDEPMARGFVPLISSYWSDAGNEIRARIGLEPDAWPSSWNVSDPHLREKIATASLNFCRSTNATTSMALGDALVALRRELAQGVVERGEGVAELTKRVQGVFDGAEKYRARRIAATETSRAVHQAAYESVRESGVVAGLKILLSAHSCPLCHRIRDEVGQVRLGQDFAIIGNNPDYSRIATAPFHPSCRCTVEYVLTPEFGGPEHPEWGTTLADPEDD